MGIRQLKPVTPAARFASRPDFSEITTDKPEKSLVRKLTKTGGRNNKEELLQEEEAEVIKDLIVLLILSATNLISKVE